MRALERSLQEIGRVQLIMNETLGEYVERMIRQKGLSLRELERRCAGRVSGSHLSKIIKGVSKNITIETVVGLAMGLEVDPREIFSVASGCAVKEAEAPAVDPKVLTDTVKKIVENPHLIEAIHEWSRMSVEDRKIMLASLRFMNEHGKHKVKKKR
jgi:transcriptional regulator with XRE-family HTH domain